MDGAPAPARVGRRLIGLALAVSLVAAACGGATSEDDGAGPRAGTGLEAEKLTAADGESGLAEAGEPVRGGTLTYGLEGESNGGFCLTEAQLAISGMMVVRALYDTLAVPNAEGDYVPYLAKSITSNDDATVWTIGLRDGITFHDGSPLTAEVVKNNLDAYRGSYPNRSSLLFAFLLRDVSAVEVVDDLTVEVTTSRPWPAFPAQLYASSRLGIMAQAQLDDPSTCGQKPIGTGPFAFESWTPNTKLVATRNADYWQIAPDGEPYPYADEIEFQPIPDGQIITNAVLAGDVNVMHTANPKLIGGPLKEGRDDGKVNLLVSSERAEVSFVQFNNQKPPFDDVRMRRAFAHAIDRDDANQFQNDGYATVVDGPIPPGLPGHVEDPGYPEFDLEQAKALVAEYEADGGDASFTFSAGNDGDSVRFVEYFRQKLGEVGMDVTIRQLDQAAAINAALGGDYQASLFRNFPGGDPDELKVWFSGGIVRPDGETVPNPVNLAHFDDPEVNDALETGRVELDEAKRTAIYEDLNRRMASEVFDAWLWNVPWGIATGADVHGILGPPLPGDDISEPGPATIDDPARQPSQGLATGHSLLGLWVEG